MSETTPRQKLEALSRKLQRIYSLVLATEREFDGSATGLALLDRLVKDPQWAWLRPLSLLTAEIDHALAQSQPPTVYDYAVVASHIRGLIAGESDLRHDPFLDRYRSLLQLNPELAAAHGELKAMLRDAPTESADEAERLHRRHQWNERVRHRTR